MSFAQDHLDHSAERGADFIPGYVCPAHIDNPYIQAFIRAHAEDDCTYCGAPNAAPTDDVVSFIMRAVSTEYGQADTDEPVARDSENDYAVMFTETFDGVEVLTWGAGLELSSQLEDHLTHAMSDYTWVDRDPYGPRPHEAHAASWAKFMQVTRHAKGGPAPTADEEDRWYGLIAPEQMLRFVEASLKLLEGTPVFRWLPAGTSVYRVRLSPTPLTDLAELGPPPARYAQSQRLSRAGQVALYTAMTEETALAEVRGVTGDVANLSRFVTQRPLLTLDFTALPERPDLFDDARRALRMTVPFMEAFVADITEPVLHRDASDSWVYEPTQQLADLLRTYVTTDGQLLSGVLYPSSRAADVNAAFFMDASRLGEEGSGAALTLDRAALKHLDQRAREQ